MGYPLFLMSAAGGDAMVIKKVLIDDCTMFAVSVSHAHPQVLENTTYRSGMRQNKS